MSADFDLETLTCPACAAAEAEPLADLGPVPVLSGVTFETRERAVASLAAPMTLVACPCCSHVYNAAFDPSLIDYDAGYDNSLHYSQTFQAYASQLADRLAHEHHLEGRHVVELGSGKGHFLVELCLRARARGTGYDPTYDGKVSDPTVTFVREFMSWDEPADFDFFVARHVLEHLDDPWTFLSNLRKVCGKRAVTGYIEVPDAIYDFERSPWNCLYPHASYFSATALSRLAIRAGFGILQLVRNLEGQYLALELGANVPTPGRTPFDGMGVPRERDILDSFRDTYPAMVAGWRKRLQAIGYERCALWGAGAKGLSFLGAVDPERRFAAVVDLNVAKHGRYLPVTGHQIISPSDLPAQDIAVVVITNPVYRSEIEQALKDLGVSAEVLSGH